ncbi:MAG: ComEC/Rec2 family competence protein [Bacteroidales bacterium]|nr:ComEC/Rec2 family competence protein [Bacteroidales bacterium]
MLVINDIKSSPVFRPLVFLIAGILLVSMEVVKIKLLFYIGVLLFLSLCLFSTFRFMVSRNLIPIKGLLICLSFLCIGTLIGTINKKPGLNQIPVAKEIYLGEIFSQPVQKNGFVSFEFICAKYKSQEKFIKVLVSMKSVDSLKIPEAGEILVVSSALQTVPGPMNPGEFDYSEYLRKQGILYRMYLKDENWKILSYHSGFSFRLKGLKLKKILWSKIENSHSVCPELGVLYALGLGSKELLEPDLKEAYKGAGVMHVLALSGLHIGLLWMSLGYLFFWLDPFPGGKVLKFFCISVMIWFYAIMTGMSASVVRSAAMFSFVGFGKLVQKESSIYNSLFISAFFCLLLKPQWLSEPGFQLSYSAVFSIVFFQPLISNLYQKSPKLLRKIFDICSVSLAAQLGTLPLTLYLFNRIPPWFLLSNLVVIPLVSLIMIFFILFLVFMAFPLIYGHILTILILLIRLMNNAVMHIDRLPSGFSDSIYLSQAQIFMLVISLACLCFFIPYRRNFAIITGLLSLMVLFVIGTIDLYKSGNRREMVIFSSPGHTVLGLFQGNNGLILHDSLTENDIQTIINNKCRPYLLKNRIRDIKISDLNADMAESFGIIRFGESMNHCFNFGEKSILILNEADLFRNQTAPFPLKADYTILSEPLPWKRKNQQVLIKSENLILSSSLSKYYNYRKQNESIIEADSIYDTRQWGAYRIDLSKNLKSSLFKKKDKSLGRM